jgi:ribosomal protein L19E
MKHTKNLSFIKEKISEDTGVGKSRIRFNSESLKLIYDKNKTLNEIVKTLVTEKKTLLRIIPKKKRIYKILQKEKKKIDPELLKRVEANLKPHQKIIYKKTSSLKYLKSRKIVTDKDIWIKKVREYRKLLKENKTFLGKNYRILRNKIKGNVYPTTKDLLSDICRLKLS